MGNSPREEELPKPFKKVDWWAWIHLFIKNCFEKKKNNTETCQFVSSERKCKLPCVSLMTTDSVTFTSVPLCEHGSALFLSLLTTNLLSDNEAMLSRLSEVCLLFSEAARLKSGQRERGPSAFAHYWKPNRNTTHCGEEKSTKQDTQVLCLHISSYTVLEMIYTAHVPTKLSWMSQELSSAVHVGITSMI